jgi:hypothetical protein
MCYDHPRDGKKAEHRLWPIDRGELGDTRAFLWFQADSTQHSPNARAHILNSANKV